MSSRTRRYTRRYTGVAPIKQLDSRLLSRPQTAALLGLGVRQVQRLRNQYRAKGGPGLVFHNAAAMR